MKTFFKYILALLGFAASLLFVLGMLDKDSRAGKVKRMKTEKRSNEKNSVDSIAKTHKTSLNERQIKILKMFRNREVLYPSDIYTLLPNVSTRTIRRDLTSLSNLNIVVQKGNTRDAHYLLAKRTNEV